jgi:peptidyl-tRNA hydrolase
MTEMSIVALGRPSAKERVVGHVLGDFSKEEQAALPEFIGKSMEGCEWWVREGMQGAMNKFNRK